LNKMICLYGLKGTVICHQVEKPAYVKSRVWNIASGREAIRRYFLSQPEADRLCFMDADMTYDLAAIDILEKQITNYDAVFSGYRFSNNQIGLIGAGCLFMKRKTAEKLKFRCYEFKNGQVIFEDNLAEMDLFSHACRIKKGIFLSIDHYSSASEVAHIDPQKVRLYRRIMTGSLIRYCLFAVSVAIHYNIPSKGQRLLWFFIRIGDKLRSN
jgi:hypothetical protein